MSLFKLDIIIAIANPITKQRHLKKARSPSITVIIVITITLVSFTNSSFC
ncbi:MAG: hypothetical protein RMY62_030795 [Nostoc sp. ZfuVER08]|nr:hypothetical protein [Nostoc sp. ZfuVER08]